MNNIGQRAASIRQALPEGVELVAVSKFQPQEAIMEAYRDGQRAFGESRVSELAEKAAALPEDIQWHFIGHVQTNKLRKLIGKTWLIESVDSERLLDLIDSESSQAGIVTRVLLQVHIAREETKYGFTPEELLSYFRDRRYERLKSTHLCGLMAMASNTDDSEQVRREFSAVASLRKEILAMRPDLRGFDTLSMGMSDDYPIAIEEGANSIRIGSKIFGERPYDNKSNI